MLNRKVTVNRHDPVLTAPNPTSPLTIGNGRFAFTADVTGMQSLYEEHVAAGNTPLCTMSQWGWHTKPNQAGGYYSVSDLVQTQYRGSDRLLTYPVERKPGNEEVYDWLRENPHRSNLLRLRLFLDGEPIHSNQLSQIHQRLDLYTGVLFSRFRLDETSVEVQSVCGDADCLGFYVYSPLLGKRLTIVADFPCGTSDITGSDWSTAQNDALEFTRLAKESTHKELVHRQDLDSYYVDLSAKSGNKTISFTIGLAPNRTDHFTDVNFDQLAKESMLRWEKYWLSGGFLSFSGSKDPRAEELERRVICSQYLLAAQCCEDMPPQETGLTCNSWYGKFHLEMHPLHSAYLALWGHTELLERSFAWYVKHLPQAVANAAVNGYAGARWPKMVGPQAVDSPSVIAPLLIWQQPHLLYLLELVYVARFGTGTGRNQEISADAIKWMNRYEELVCQTADFMVSFLHYQKETDRYALYPPLIPAQENHNATDTVNPTFELAYWRLGLRLAAGFLQRIGKDGSKYEAVAARFAPLPVKDGLLLAHENCPDTYGAFAEDHPSMLFVYGFLPGEDVDRAVVAASCDRMWETWDLKSLWGWDFALLAMTEGKLGRKEEALNILMMQTDKNCYVKSGHNAQKGRNDLPLYLPGNGALLLAVAYLAEQELFPDGITVQKEQLHPYPFR